VEIRYIFPNLVFCVKKNLATVATRICLALASHPPPAKTGPCHSKSQSALSTFECTAAFILIVSAFFSFFSFFWAFFCSSLHLLSTRPPALAAAAPKINV
jgi:hypothetical protein